MKQQIIILFFSMISFSAYSQEIIYSYDIHGNRIKREYIPLRIAMDSLGTGEELAKDLMEEMGISIYPNPADDVVNISITNKPEGERATAIVYDMSGRELQTKELVSTLTPLDFSGFSPGIYHIRLRVGKEEIYYKIMKKH
jgi:hypothetical protein